MKLEFRDKRKVRRLKMLSSKIEHTVSWAVFLIPGIGLAWLPDSQAGPDADSIAPNPLKSKMESGLQTFLPKCCYVISCLKHQLMAIVPIFGLLASSPGTPTSHIFIYAFSGVSLLNKYPGAGLSSVLFPAVSLYLGAYLACPRVDWGHGTSGSS